MTQWKRKIVVMSPDGCYKSAYFGMMTQKDSSSDPAVPGLQEAPPTGPQGTAKHPAPGGASGFLEPSSCCVNSHCSVEQGSGFLFWEPWIISMGIISALLNNFSYLELFPFSLSARCHFLFPCSLILIILECFFPLYPSFWILLPRCRSRERDFSSSLTFSASQETSLHL